MSVSSRLDKVFSNSEEINIDDKSKIVFISDCHRGDGSWADNFSRNQQLYQAALAYYYRKNFTYIEIGDGDELWQNRRFAEIKQMHVRTFEILNKFYEDNRFYMIYGNHDMVKKYEDFARDNLYQFHNERGFRKSLFKGIKIHEGLILRYSGTPVTIFAVHGHQGDLLNDRLWKLGRFLVRYVWRPLELIGFSDPTSPAKNITRKNTVERNISNWAKKRHVVVIAGHTHRPVLPETDNTPYLNDGSCVHPRSITAIELCNGELTLVKWIVKVKESGLLYVSREPISDPKKITDFRTP
jgi:UDP-2,3-diacylglucosamine pyrophosphatase LpxH